MTHDYARVKYLVVYTTKAGKFAIKWNELFLHRFLLRADGAFPVALQSIW
jgi:hypothetical protein